MLNKLTFYYSGILVVFLMLTGCQPKVYLMPPPIGIQSDGVLFELTEGSTDENLLYTLYATNRQPVETNNKSDHYTIFPSDVLKLGFVVHRVGEGEMSWNEIYKESLKTKRSKELLLTRVYAREVVTYDIKDDLTKTSAQEDGFFMRINELLDKSIDKDILIYAHGANSNFYRATAQGAQLHHFTGHNSVVLSFSWPSAENIFRYKTDVLHAKQTVPAFARLVELLANHTKAKHINILAYSAGAQVVTPALALFEDIYPDMSKEDLKKKLRIGEVYFAAPDTAFKPFAQRYMKFKDIVERTTVNINQNDSVLRFSAFENGMSRLGRPDFSEVTEEELNILIEASRTSEFDLLDVSGSEVLDIGGAHDSWYNNTWVSSDVLMLLLFNASPLERGLVEHWYSDRSRGYRFPSDYDIRLHDIVTGHREELFEKLKSEGRD
ncbi:MAG: esterase/lipase superfamily enzyme [Desulforhopalus sp.]|jgi:esterase/lipase superfamily enzyme